MWGYINEIIDSLPDDMRGTAASLTPSYLFKVDDTNTNKLDTATFNLFHHCTAQLLFLTRHKNLSYISLHKSLRIRHWWLQKTLACVMKYLQMYPHLPLILCSDGKGNIYWSVDAAFVVQNGMRGHTGAHMSIQQGTVVTKQNMST